MTETKAKIGLEVHARLKTRTKLFCPCSTSQEKEQQPNTRVCPVCMGFPGAKPSLGREALRKALQIALALKCEMPKQTVFSRKTYYYPDLAKNYQITQYEQPVGTLGSFEFLHGTTKTVQIRRVQLEEDPAQISYAHGILLDETCLIDYSRSGTPLCEIVTEPCFESGVEAHAFLKQLFKTLVHIGVVDKEADGTMRCDANVSINSGARIEIKNITGFAAVERAISAEIMRQDDFVRNKNGTVAQETRAWIPETKTTVSLRKKATESDYGYIIEADLPVVILDTSAIDRLKLEMPLLPEEEAEHLARAFGIDEKTAKTIVYAGVSDVFQKTAEEVGDTVLVAHWCMVDLLKCLHYSGKTAEQVPIKEFIELLKSVKAGRTTARAGKELIKTLFLGVTFSPQAVIDDEQIRSVSLQIIASHPKAVSEYRSGKTTALELLLGQLVRKTGGQVDVQKARQTLESLLRS